MLLRMAGMSVLNIWGGDWERGAIDLDEIEFMVVARKTGEKAPFDLPEEANT